MSNDITKQESTKQEIDGFEAYEDGVEGNTKEQQSDRVIQGTLVKFTNEAQWVTNTGEEISANLELVAVNVGRVVQKWKDQAPVETIVLEAGQKFPDVEALNENTPKSEWTEGPDGRMRGPWQAQHLVYLLDPTTMDTFTYPTGTVGGGIAVRELVDRTRWMRRFRGANVFAVVTLSDTHMNTRFGGRQRPHFLIKRWVALGPGGVLPAAEQPALTSSVNEPTLKEEMKDEVRF